MTTRTKMTLIILATLVIGIILGAAGSGMLFRHVFGFPPGPPSEGRIRMILERVIDPTEEQRAQLDVILDKYSVCFDSMMTEHIVTSRSMMDSLRAEIDPILTEEQRAKLNDKLSRFERFMKGRAHRKDGRRPFGGKGRHDDRPRGGHFRGDSAGTLPPDSGGVPDSGQ